MIDVKVFNLLVHYGEDDQKNLVDLLEDGLFKYLEAETLHGNSNPAYVKSIVPFETSGGRPFITGVFHRASELKWDFVPKHDYKAKVEHGSQHVMPQARFYIDLLDHKLFWITERGKTHKPNAKNFEAYLKSGFLPILRAKYRDIANTVFEQMFAETAREKRPKKAEFRTEFLTSRRLFHPEFKLNLVPLIADKELETYFKDKRYKINKVKFTPHISNPTNEDLADLFVDVAKLGSKTGAKVNLELSAANKNDGINKVAVKNIFDKNKQKQLVDVRMVVEDQNSPEEKPLTISNKANQNGHHQITDISITFEFSASIHERGILDIVITKFGKSRIVELNEYK